jgi:hypothetical protein
MSRQQAHGRIPLQNQSPLGGRLAGTLAVKYNTILECIHQGTYTKVLALAERL